jgi:hypothetical protein
MGGADDVAECARLHDQNMRHESDVTRQPALRELQIAAFPAVFPDETAVPAHTLEIHRFRRSCRAASI